MDVLWPPRNQPKTVKRVARTSTPNIATQSCQDGMDDQNGPLARVMKINQFSVKQISKKTIASMSPKFCTIPPFSPPTSMVERQIQVPAARTMPRMIDIPHNLGKFHLTGVLEYGALS